jgi:hypothetical protein
MRHQLAWDELKVDCPHCRYFEVWDSPRRLNFMACRQPQCARVTCFVCKEDCTGGKGLGVRCVSRRPVLIARFIFAWR